MNKKWLFSMKLIVRSRFVAKIFTPIIIRVIGLLLIPVEVV